MTNLLINYVDLASSSMTAMTKSRSVAESG